MHNAANAYAKNAQQTGNPRELEAQLLMRAAAKLQAVHDGSLVKSEEVVSAIRYNRRLWTLFGGSVGRPENPLPAEIKQNLANLANFVVNHSMKLETSTESNAGRVGVLININREIAAGLRTNLQAA
ncbi:MAG: flagellar biosynthesis regulator FlaF [Xanthobacteraceae bacterium]|nr:flagellar biosynthesis regulator FlaF [Xanthobacteraceae bacterium]MBX3521934.1 flagellar biosynthesis regulator FlaF [Xanthobacteraceae bacterium]MBX3533648.1 flagellar biosynthesis regulator FlaF [Xanthobacteraceae bacterium]MBX3548261.1 flagellar biosynthesis regulator FlaF [Xanthobacteraceae bacterium]MCW5675762.1 flagellar biosynthesis regulator FlaF [Xanthobacteraceae bacterium]